MGDGALETRFTTTTGFDFDADLQTLSPSERAEIERSLRQRHAAAEDEVLGESRHRNFPFGWVEYVVLHREDHVEIRLAGIRSDAEIKRWLDRVKEPGRLKALIGLAGAIVRGNFPKGEG